MAREGLKDEKSPTAERRLAAQLREREAALYQTPIRSTAPKTSDLSGKTAAPDSLSDNPQAVSTQSSTSKKAPPLTPRNISRRAPGVSCQDLSSEQIKYLRDEERRLNATRWPAQPKPYSPALSLLPMLSATTLSPERQTAIEQFEMQKNQEFQRLKALEVSGQNHQYSPAFTRAFENLEDISEQEAINFLEAHKANHVYLLQASRAQIIEHAARRVDLFFYTLVAYYRTGILPIQSDTILQYGSGRNSSTLVPSKKKGSAPRKSLKLTAACHSNLFPQLMDESINQKTDIQFDPEERPALRRRSILCGTHFADAANSTVELIVAVNNLDCNLERTKTNPSELRKKTIKILHRVAKGEINPVQGLTEYLILMEDTLNKLYTNTKSGAYIKTNRDTAPAAIKPELLRLVFSGTTGDKLIPITRQVNLAYTDLLLRLTPAQIAECQESHEKREQLYAQQFEKLQREILNSPATHTVSDESFTDNLQLANHYFEHQEYELALEYYEYAHLHMPQRYAILEKMADTQMLLKNYADALQNYERAFALAVLEKKNPFLIRKKLAFDILPPQKEQPSTLAIKKKDALKALLAQAKNCFHQGAYQQARISYERALPYVSIRKKSKIFYKIGQVWQVLQMPVKAENAYQKTIFYCEVLIASKDMSKEKKALALNLKAEALYAMRRYTEAHTCFQAACLTDMANPMLGNFAKKKPSADGEAVAFSVAADTPAVAPLTARSAATLFARANVPVPAAEKVAEDARLGPE